ncbi:MAG: hypothetical protein ACKVYV_18300 [Limisphaerales bacterium]
MDPQAFTAVMEFVGAAWRSAFGLRWLLSAGYRRRTEQRWSTMRRFDATLEQAAIVASLLILLLLVGFALAAWAERRSNRQDHAMAPAFRVRGTVGRLSFSSS